MQDVIVTKYERFTNHFGIFEYFFTVGIVPGGRVVNTFYVPTDAYDVMEATEKVTREIKDYLKESNFNSLSKF